MKSFEQLGEKVRAGLERGSDPAALAEQRQRLLDGLDRSTGNPNPGSRWGLRLAVAACFGLVAVGALVWAPWRTSHVPSCLRDDGRPVRPGDWLSTGVDQQLSLRFSDKSQVQVRSSTNLWVADLTADRVRLSLQTGRLDLQVRPRTGLTWRIQGGPYQVEVVGTRFSMEWDPAAQDLDVSVERGAVKVRGGPLGSREVVVRAGENLHSRLDDDRVATWTRPRAGDQPAADPEPPEPVDAQPQLAEPIPADPPTPVADRVRTRPRPSARSVAPEADEPEPDTQAEVAFVQPVAPEPPAPDWQQLAAGGRYGEALRKVQAQGIEEVLAQHPAEDLLLLADAARLARRGDLARQALLAVRARFPAGPQRTQAAIRLGRLEASTGAFQASARWLERYLEEAPQGRWAAEARGRLLEAWMELGRNGRAKRVARDVLRYDGDGPYRETAERLLGVAPPK